MKKTILLFVIISILSTTVSASGMIEIAKIQASDAEANDQFGNSVSISSDGNTAIVGADGESTGGSYAGAAYIFRGDGTTWTQQVKIMASDKEANDRFGDSVSISSDGNSAIVGAYLEDTGGLNAGAAYLFGWNGTNWTQQAKIMAGDNETGDFFGDSVSISSDGSSAIVGAYNEDTGGSNAGAAYIFQSTASSQLPTYTTFTSAETTNFSSVNLTSVPNLTLAINGKGKIRFPSDHNINTENEDYDTNIDIGDALIYVNSAALHSSFNNSATLTFNNIDCSVPYVYYSETASTRSAILLENKLCPSSICSNIQCTGSTLTVDVLHFSGYAVNGSANLTIDADDPKYPLETVIFTAEYMNATGLITGAICNISFSDGSYIMDEQATYYNYSRTFASAQIVEYNVTCNKAGENTVFANDTAVIQSVDIPEFSLMTLGLGLTAVLAGLIIIRKKH